MNLGEELNQATAMIERQRQDINDLEEEVRKLRALKVELGSGDLAERMVRAALVEEAKKRFAKTKANTITYVLKRDYTMTIGGVRYVVRIREVDV